MKNSAAYKWAAIVAVTTVFAAPIDSFIEQAVTSSLADGDGHINSQGGPHGFKDLSKIKSSLIKSCKKRCHISLINS